MPGVQSEAFVNAAEDVEEEETVRLIIYRYHQLTSKWLAYPAAERLYRDLKRHKREQKEKYKTEMPKSTKSRETPKEKSAKTGGTTMDLDED